MVKITQELVHSERQVWLGIFCVLVLRRSQTGRGALVCKWQMLHMLHHNSLHFMKMSVIRNCILQSILPKHHLHIAATSLERQPPPTLLVQLYKKLISRSTPLQSKHFLYAQLYLRHYQFTAIQLLLLIFKKLTFQNSSLSCV